MNDGSDYIKMEGTLWFRHGEASKTIDLIINPNAHVRSLSYLCFDVCLIDLSE